MQPTPGCQVSSKSAVSSQSGQWSSDLRNGGGRIRTYGDHEDLGGFQDRSVRPLRHPSLKEKLGEDGAVELQGAVEAAGPIGPEADLRDQEAQDRHHQGYIAKKDQDQRQDRPQDLQVRLLLFEGGHREDEVKRERGPQPKEEPGGPGLHVPEEPGRPKPEGPEHGIDRDEVRGQGDQPGHLVHRDGPLLRPRLETLHLAP